MTTSISTRNLSVHRRPCSGHSEVRQWLARTQQYVISGFERLGDWQERMVQRRTLMKLDERMLHDIGLCRDDAIAEATKPFWKV